MKASFLALVGLVAALLLTAGCASKSTSGGQVAVTPNPLNSADNAISLERELSITTGTNGQVSTNMLERFSSKTPLAVKLEKTKYKYGYGAVNNWSPANDNSFMPTPAFGSGGITITPLTSGGRLGN